MIVVFLRRVCCETNPKSPSLPCLIAAKELVQRVWPFGCGISSLWKLNARASVLKFLQWLKTSSVADKLCRLVFGSESWVRDRRFLKLIGISPQLKWLEPRPIASNLKQFIRLTRTEQGKWLWLRTMQVRFFITEPLKLTEPPKELFLKLRIWRDEEFTSDAGNWPVNLFDSAEKSLRNYGKGWDI